MGSEEGLALTKFQRQNFEMQTVQRIALVFCSSVCQSAFRLSTGFILDAAQA